MRGSFDLDDFSGPSTPLVSDFGHAPEAGEEGIDRTGQVNDLIAASEFRPDQSALKAKLGRLLNEQHGFHTRPAGKSTRSPDSGPNQSKVNSHTISPANPQCPERAAHTARCVASFSPDENG